MGNNSAFYIEMGIFEESISTNCDACGLEYTGNELKTAYVRPFKNALKICKECLIKGSAESYRDAADIIRDVKKIAKGEDGSTPEQRLKAIQALLEV